MITLSVTGFVTAADALVAKRDSDLTVLAKMLLDNLAPVAPLAVPST